MNQLYRVTIMHKSGHVSNTAHVRAEHFSNPHFLVLELENGGREAYSIAIINVWISEPEKGSP